MFTIIAENINVMKKKIGRAMKARDKKPIQVLAEKLVANGVHYLDINLGPARKKGDEVMKFMVETVREVTDLPLYLDTVNPVAMEAGLQACEKDANRPVINSIDARGERMDEMIPLAQKYNAGFVALVMGDEGIPRDANERAANAAMLMAKSAEYGIEPANVWIDPIVLPVSSQQNQVQGCTEFMTMLPEMAMGFSTTCGLSNVSNGSPKELRPLLNQCYLLMLRKIGLTGAILDGLDTEILKFSQGGYPELEKVVADVMDGTVDLSSLSEVEMRFAKTTRVLMGQALYSDSWLEL